MANVGILGALKGVGQGLQDNAAVIREERESEADHMRRMRLEKWKAGQTESRDAAKRTHDQDMEKLRTKNDAATREASDTRRFENERTIRSESDERRFTQETQEKDLDRQSRERIAGIRSAATGNAKGRKIKSYVHQTEDPKTLARTNVPAIFDEGGTNLRFRYDEGHGDRGVWVRIGGEVKVPPAQAAPEALALLRENVAKPEVLRQFNDAFGWLPSWAFDVEGI